MKNRKMLFYIMLTLVIALCIFYFYPKNLNKEYNAIKYRLGDSSDSENIKISIDGYISKRLFRGDRFRGSINIGGKQLKEIDLRFDSTRRATIYYMDAGSDSYYTYGTMVSNNMKDSFTILIFEADEKEKASAGSSWSSKDGLMISAPANNRSEALDISNRLMKGSLNNVELK